VDQERLLKRVWLVNGLLLAVLFVALAVWLVVELGSSWFHRHSAVIPATHGAPVERTSRAVRYDPPQSIWKSTTRIVLVRYGEAFERPAHEFASSNSYGERYALYVNAIFLEPGGGPGHLLLDRPALIRSVNFPRSKDDSLQAWITYEIAFEDTDGDRGLDEDDAASLYVSDLHGGSFRRVLPEGWSVLAHEPLDGHRIVVLALRSAEPGDRRSLDETPERAFFYDVQTGPAEPYTALDSLAARAARIVGR
jgi:hypothetical protein